MRISITIKAYQNWGGQMCTMHTAAHMQARDALAEAAVLLGYDPRKIFNFDVANEKLNGKINEKEST